MRTQCSPRLQQAQSSQVANAVSPGVRARACPRNPMVWGEAARKERAEWLALFQASEGGRSPSEFYRTPGGGGGGVPAGGGGMLDGVAAGGGGGGGGATA